VKFTGSKKAVSSRTLTNRFVLALLDTRSQTACGAWVLASFNSGTVTSYGKVRSNLPAMKARIAVERLGMIVYSAAPVAATT